MKYRFSLFYILVFCAVVTSGCSSSNSSAPPDNIAHPTGWLASHSSAISSNADYADCTSCHGSDLAGSGDAVSCYVCHTYNSSIPFSTHPSTWTNVVNDHRGYAVQNTAVTCVGCHARDLMGTTAAPSCYSTSYDGISCHTDGHGPGTAPHPLDGSYLNYQEHGSAAKTDLEVCQTCHGELIPAGTSPRFDVGITSINSSGCEGCHNDYAAHPSVGDRESVHWYGATVTHADSGNLEACALCHGDTYQGNADTGAPACLACHIADPVANNDGCVSCHALPPDGAGLAGDTRPNRQGSHNRVGHRYIACARCHNGAGADTDNHYDTPDPADVVFLHPDATDTIQAASDGSNTTCTGACHIVDGDILWNHDNASWY